MLVVMEVVVARVHIRSGTIVLFGETMSLGRTSHELFSQFLFGNRKEKCFPWI